MKYPVIVQDQALIDAEGIRADLAAVDPDYAERWVAELEQMIASLSEFPNRFALAPESPRCTFLVRQVLVGKYRILYAVRGDTVRIMRIAHAARRPFKPGDLN